MWIQLSECIMYVAVHGEGPHTRLLCGLLCGPVKSACHQWLNVFFLHFYGAKMFLSSPCDHSSCFTAGFREAEVSSAAIICQLITELPRDAQDMWHSKESGQEVLTGFWLDFTSVVFLEWAMMLFEGHAWTLDPVASSWLHSHCCCSAL